jgi:hypothetical protein
MARPALVVVYEERGVLAALEQALQSRFGADYQISRQLARRLPWTPSGGSARPASRSRWCWPTSGWRA